MTPLKYVGVILAHTNANFRLFLHGRARIEVRALVARMAEYHRHLS